MRGDLHVHTNNSDGSQSASQVIEMAARIGLTHIAITDHDHRTYTDELARFAQNLGVTLIDGVEISTMDTRRKRRVHVLCYMPQNPKAIDDICTNITNLRIKAGADMAKQVCELYPITMQEIEEVAKDSHCIYKQHIAKALMNAGFTTKIFGNLYSELFDSNKGKCIINFPQPDVMDVARAVREAGGIGILAHPYTYNSIEILTELCEQNLIDGLEVWSSKATEEQEEFLSKFADKYDVTKTGGSDFHGGYSSRVSPLGKRTTPDKYLDALFEIKKGR